MILDSSEHACVNTAGETIACFSIMTSVEKMKSLSVSCCLKRKRERKRKLNISNWKL